MEKIHVVTAVDFVENTNSKARVLGAFRKEEDARNLVRNDMEDTLDNLAGARVEADFDLMQVIIKDNNSGCLWNECGSN